MVAMDSAVRSGLWVVETKPQVMTRSLRECWPSHIPMRVGSLLISNPSIWRWCSGWPKPAYPASSAKPA